MHSTILLTLVSILPSAIGCTGTCYGAFAALLGAAMILMTMQLDRGSGRLEAIAARRLFAFSILYIFVLFVALLADTAMPRGHPFV